MLLNPFGLTPRAIKKIANRQDQAANNFFQQQTLMRDRAIARWYTQGSEHFLEWVRSYYRLNDDNPLSWDEPHMEGMYRLMGCPWVETLVVEKPAQRGFTESVIALMAFSLSEIRVVCALGFEAEGKLRDIVGPRIQPSFDRIPPIKEIRRARFFATKRKDTDFQQRKMTVGGVEMTLFYTSTVNTKKGQAEAPSSMRSFPCCIGAGDEIELWPTKAISIFRERYEASRLPSKPMRLGSTPGLEGGIVDTLVKKSGVHFRWQIVCPECDRPQWVHPFGNFLKPVEQTQEDGSTEIVYYDTTGRPLEWFCRDDSTLEQAIATAYVGCQHCGAALSQQAIARGQFLTQDGLTIQQFEAGLLRERSPYPKTVALSIPALISQRFNPASRIRSLLDAADPTDQYQQGLGLAVAIGGGKINMGALLACCDRTPEQVWGDRPEPLPEPSLIVVGMDQGKAFNWAIVQRWWLAEGDTWELRWKNAIKQVVSYEQVAGFEGMLELAQRHGAHLLGFDGEPEVEKASDFTLAHPIYTSPGTNGKLYQAFQFDQVILKGERFRDRTITVQAKQVRVFSIDRTFGLDAVKNRIYRRLQCIPPMEYRAGDDNNPLYHYLTQTRTPQRKWEKPDGLPDHWAHADNFCEMAVYVAGYANLGREFAFGSLSR